MVQVVEIIPYVDDDKDFFTFESIGACVNHHVPC